MAYKRVSHVIFDMDGLILDTETIYTEVYQKVIDPYDKKYTWDVKKTLMGSQAQESAQQMIDIYNLPMTWQEFNTQVGALNRIAMADAQLLPGAERLIRHLHKSNVPFCLGTSSGKEMAEIKYSKHQELFDLFNHKVMGSSDPEVKNGKPHPDIFLVAANRFPDKPDPANCLVFEDAPSGVQAALAAGMQCVMVPDERMDDETKKDATVVLKSLLDFKPEQFGLPPFSD